MFVVNTLEFSLSIIYPSVVGSTNIYLKGIGFFVYMFPGIKERRYSDNKRRRFYKEPKSGSVTDRPDRADEVVCPPYFVTLLIISKTLSVFSI